MTKFEKAIRIATAMKQIREDVDIERLAKRLSKGMTDRELNILLDSYKA